MMTDEQQLEALEALDTLIEWPDNGEPVPEYDAVRTYILNSTQREERDQYRDMARDYATQLDAIRQALGVKVEPHQTLDERLLDAARESTPVPEWQRIETAPKDGRAILGWADDVITTVYWDSGLRDWELCECGAFATDGAFSPEFWMPVPQDPTPEPGRQRFD